MSKLSRRRLLQTSAALGVTGLVSQNLGTEVVQSTPDLEKYAQPLPIPGVLEPEEQRDGVDYYNISITEFTQSLHPDLPDTTVWGFDGSFPGPIIEAQKDEPIKVEFDNSLPDEHLLEVDETVHGTTTENHFGHDGEVPEVRNSTHFHGLNIEPESDGQSTMWVSPDGVEGPRRTKDVQDVPNAQSRMTSMYHAHTLGITRLNAYAGLAGLYYIRSEEEEQLNLPSGEYDIPLVIQDRSFNDDGSLDYPDSFVSEPSGDTAVVNGAIWPSLEVEPRKYRFRIVNGSNHRAYDMTLSSESGSEVPTMYQFATGHGFLEDVVTIEDGGDMDSLLLTPFERGEVIVDFSDYAGETFTLTNDAGFPLLEDDPIPSNLPELLQIQVTAPSETPSDSSADPATLDLPSPTEFDEDEAVETRHFTLDMETDYEDGPDVVHLLNGYGMGDEDAPLPQPELGTTEIWEFENTTSHAHPMHLHLVDFRVIGRGSGGEDDPDPNELGGKDTVRVEPNETVRIATEFGDFTGKYPFHCHALEHEDHKMMLMFEVVEGDGDGNEGTLTHHDPAELDHVGDDVDHVIQWEGSTDD